MITKLNRIHDPHHRGEGGIDLMYKSDVVPNLGLAYQKYTYRLYRIMDNGEFKKDEERVRAFFDVFTSLDNFTSFLEKINSRCTVIKSYADHAFPMKAQSNFFVGSGYVNTTEWGMSFDWTSGLPYMPGSSLKGALLAYLEFQAEGNVVQDWPKKGITKATLENGDKWTHEQIIKVFGPQGDISDSDAHRGGVAFFDVLPTCFKGFELEVITPHYGEYYSSEGKKPPADIYSPIPNHFLTVKAGSIFQFAFKILDSDVVEVEKMKNLITEAGDYWGFGAKTSSGYGMFKE